MVDIVVEPGLPDAAEQFDDERSSWPGWKFAVLVVVMFILGAVIASIRLPYLALRPGNTFETEIYIAVEGTEAFPSPDGEVYFVTVNQARLNPFEWVLSSLSDSDEVFHEDDLLRGRTFDEQREENATLMLSSQNTSIMAALSELGYDVIEPAGAVVEAVVPGGQTDGTLALNDLITAINDQPILTVDELYDTLVTAETDEMLVIAVQTPGGAPRDLTVTVSDDTSAFLGVIRSETQGESGNGAFIADVVEGGPVSALLQAEDRIVRVGDFDVLDFASLRSALDNYRSGDEVTVEAVRMDGTTAVGSVVLGVRAFERIGILSAQTQFHESELPISVDITTEDVGGPSAGLAFALTILDVLTEGELTGGANIVATGTINFDGTVGPIGGVHQKAFAAEDADAAVFIVPTANLAEAQAAVPDLRIEPVATLDDALEIIAEFGGNALELPELG
ncbi:MAG: PDZ domain-containing protein [Acidimicrobiales bacterium]|nr:PDZ domain-containing protein [Acidimicrobiales bacterium]RZV46027.1 MAG: PDZ domain-containing protein [Acidimicrobiales bacterium]